MTVEEMLSRMSSMELAEWIAFSKVEPIGDEREDIRIGMLATLWANINRNPEVKKEPFKLDDFIFDYWKKPSPPEEVTDGWKHNLEVARMIHEALKGEGGKDGSPKRAEIPGSPHKPVPQPPGNIDGRRPKERNNLAPQRNLGG
jgi:hypothetical protein